MVNIGPLSNTPRTSPPAANLEAMRIGAAMEHIKAHGNLDGFPAGRSERLALVSTASRQGLLVWNRSRGRYELTSRGYRHVRAHRRAGRNALRERPAGVIRAGMNAVVTGAGAVLVVGALYLAFNPTGSTNLAPTRGPGAYFTSRAAAPVPARPEVQSPRNAEPKVVAAAASTDPGQGAFEPSSTPPTVGRTDALMVNPGVPPGEAARFPPASVSSEPETVGAAAAAEKSVGDDRHRTETTKLAQPEMSKLAQKHKKSTRRGRSWDGERETRESRGPGYAYSRHDVRRYGYWSAPPWWYR